MATANFAYDHPQYNVHQSAGGAEAGGGATTQYGKWAAFTASQVYSVQLTVTTAGTATAHLFSLLKISGTATSTLATSTLGTNVAGYTTNLLATSVVGGAALLAGDVLSVVSGADVVGKAALSYEIATQKLGNVTT